MIRIENLSFAYKGFDTVVLNDISAEVSTGSIAFLAGASGSGKTTLLHCINGLATQFYEGELSGSIYIAGEDITDKKLGEISELAGTVFQNPNTQFFQLNVEDEILFNLERSGISRSSIEKRLTEAVRDVGIEAIRHRDLFTLSSGEKQKVALASIIAMQQPILLMDEPTANLDIASIKDLRKILQTLKRQGRTILISEHRLWYLKDIADKIIVINGGKVGYQGSCSSLEDDAFRRKFGLRMWNKSPHLANTAQSARRDLPKKALQTENLSASTIKGQLLINDISFSVSQGQCIAVMGDNGAGKTTLSRVLTGLQKQKRGAVYIATEQLKSKKRLGKIACVAQQAEQQLFADTVLGELSALTTQTPKSNDQAEKLLSLFDLLTLKNRHPQTLSGGEKQRLAIAASMMLEQNIIILDEPTGGMDSKRMQKLAQQIENLCRQGLAIIVITHDIELVGLVCDEILWMENGTIKKNIKAEQFELFFNDLLK